MTFAATPPPRSRPPQRSRARRFVPLGVAAWVVLEIWLLTLVADAAGGLTVLLLLVAGVVAGGYVIKRAGRRAWKNLTESMQPGGPAASGAPEGGPGESKTQGGGNTLPMLGGLLLMFPGLLSDAAGLLCLFPPTRKLLHRRAERLLTRRVRHTPGGLGDAFQQARMHQQDGKIVQGEVIREDEPPSPRRDDPQLPR
ncbi:FxsA family protein [Streptomyces albofaciens JCM 4342]|uniref:FxsA family membrane protein n=1 Tax=Streptomyces albofaciens TaxID=66866 RepID=UPI00123A4449|nr:FxsA family membrane protein [Streptomyces albofaciens]KAA6212215.1 FxsA family protein [Streptomyces albofaciens JCM 4342]